MSPHGTHRLHLSHHARYQQRNPGRAVALALVTLGGFGCCTTFVRMIRATSTVQRPFLGCSPQMISGISTGTSLAAGMDVASQLSAMAKGDAPGKLLPGTEMTGEVKSVTNHGAVVEISPGLTGFVHVSEIREGYIDHPDEEVSVGDMVKVRVLKSEPSFLALTMKNIGRKSVADFKTGQKVTGKVLQILNFGALVDIGADVDCLLHKSQIKAGYVKDIYEELQVGEEITATIRSKDEEARRIELTRLDPEYFFKKLQPIKIAQLKIGQVMAGIVRHVTNFGFFVDFGGESQGLVHKRGINGGIVADLSKVVKRDDRVKVKVFSLSSGKVELQLAEPLKRIPSADNLVDIDRTEWLDGVVLERQKFGTLVGVKPPQGGPQITALLKNKWMANDTIKHTAGEMIKVRLQSVRKGNTKVLVTTNLLRNSNTSSTDEA